MTIYLNLGGVKTNRHFTMTNTQRFAQRELDILVKSAPADDRPLIEPFIPEILALCEKFGNAGQSGGSAHYTASALAQAIKKLCLQEPICPIAGIGEQWVDVADLGDWQGPLFQSARCAPLFKGLNGRAYYLDAIVWKDQNGHAYTGSAKTKSGATIISRQYVKKFPFIPKTFYINVVGKEIAPRDFEFTVRDERHLARVFKYYDPYNE